MAIAKIATPKPPASFNNGDSENKNGDKETIETAPMSVPHLCKADCVLIANLALQ